MERLNCSIIKKKLEEQKQQALKLVKTDDNPNPLQPSIIDRINALESALVDIAIQSAEVDKNA